MLVPWWHWLGAACSGWGVHPFSVYGGEASGVWLGVELVLECFSATDLTL